MDEPTRKVVIAGGGTAGWLTACLVAARARTAMGAPPEVVLIESPDIPRIGVGEGTWPSMRASLQKIGLGEAELVRRCDASFKQGTEFRGWADGRPDDTYFHPFSLPAEYAQLNMAEHWLRLERRPPFAEFVTPQARVIAAGLAPKQAAMPDYAFAVNYGYHFDAQRFADVLHEHAVDRLGVDFRAATVAGVAAAADGDIDALLLDSGERVDGDLFVDCTGQRSLLIGGHYGVGSVPVRRYLLNDRAVAVQVPYGLEQRPLPSVTRATAAGAGWIWDIGLQSRRGVGYVHSSAHLDEADVMAELEAYILRTTPDVDSGTLAYRLIPFEPGYRQEFWVNNCVAVGLAGGFVEPLEASALALIEQAANTLSGQFPVNRETMRVVARRFNERMQYHWQRVVEFLKLHFAISRRDDTAYWRDNRAVATWPAELCDKLILWQQQAPWHEDAPRVDELFPSASYQYVLYGMGFEPPPGGKWGRTALAGNEQVRQILAEKDRKARQLLSRLPPNRALLETLRSLPVVA